MLAGNQPSKIGKCFHLRLRAARGRPRLEARWLDPKLLYMGRIPFGVAGQIATARGLARMMRALFFPPLKCLALDLDNTLWGGILGEDGPGGIALGEDFPGNVYKAFQRYLLELKDRGILLAICQQE
jgi:predicted enzyme involved in methoxymalonyl-ACP biosynthesis